MDATISSNFVQVNDTTVHYLTAGEGEVVLLLHGWPTSSYLWRNIMPELAKTHQVIALDLPGFGKSDKKISDSYSFRYYDDLISGFLTQLGIEQVTLGVHDLGGPIGLYWMVQHMAQVKRLILFNTLVYPEVSWAVKLFVLMTLLPGIRSWLSSAGGIKWVMNFGVHQNHKLSSADIQQYQEPFQALSARKTLLKTAQRLSPKGFQEIARKLPEFAGPVQIIYGKNDKILPKVANTMSRVQKDLPQAQLVALANCGHFLQEDEPEQISEILTKFIES
ncbi:MAG: alpha/beta fold hydrolase [Flammeovirgaceae bacterium]